MKVQECFGSQDMHEIPPLTCWSVVKSSRVLQNHHSHTMLTRETHLQSILLNPPVILPKDVYKLVAIVAYLGVCYV